MIIITHPVFAVDVLVGVPFARQKRIAPRDDFAVEERRQHRIFGCEAGDFQIAAQVGVFLVDMLRNLQWIRLQMCFNANVTQ